VLSVNAGAACQTLTALALRPSTCCHSRRMRMALCQGQKTPPVLLVDGYNVLGELAKLGRGGREPDVTDSCDLVDAHAFDESARSRLELQLVAYSHSRGVKVWLGLEAGSCLHLHVQGSTRKRKELDAAAGTLPYSTKILLVRDVYT